MPSLRLLRAGYVECSLMIERARRATPAHMCMDDPLPSVAVPWAALRTGHPEPRGQSARAEADA